jgi:hypothetical protein
LGLWNDGICIPEAVADRLIEMGKIPMQPEGQEFHRLVASLVFSRRREIIQSCLHIATCWFISLYIDLLWDDVLDLAVIFFEGINIDVRQYQFHDL